MVLPLGGERDVYRLYRLACRDGVAILCSDDRRFHRRLGLPGVVAAAPASLLVRLVDQGAIDRRQGLQWLDRMRPVIDAEQYVLYRSAMERGA